MMKTKIAIIPIMRYTFSSRRRYFIMEYRSVSETAKQWNISDRRVRVLCQQGKIEGVIRKGRAWLVPKEVKKPVDGRTTRYQQTNSFYTELLLKIDELKDEMNKKCTLTQGEIKRIHDEFTIEYTYNSNAIEGNTLTLQETAMVLEGITIDKKPLKDHLEAVGHRDAFLFIQDLVRNNIPFSESIIKQIHTLVLMDRPEDRGKYRRIPVRIMGAYHVPPDPLLVPEKMENLLAEFKYNKKMHPIERAVLFHLKFEGIHPFVDGNGRTGRLLLNLMLMQEGYPPINIKYSDRKRYYEAFDAYYRDGNISIMLSIVLDEISFRLMKYW